VAGGAGGHGQHAPSWDLGSFWFLSRTDPLLVPSSGHEFDEPGLRPLLLWLGGQQIAPHTQQIYNNRRKAQKKTFKKRLKLLAPEPIQNSNQIKMKVYFE
jgi:hypothetical protein